MLPVHLHGQENPYHHSENVGSYGAFLDVWDYVLGTNTSFYKELKQVEKKKD